MEFKINGHHWKIVLKNKDEMVNLYKTEYDEEEVYFVGGLTCKPYQWIAINEDMNMEMQIKALKHELTHCYIWEYGLYNVTDFTEEMVCDLVAGINDFVIEVVDEFKKNYKKMLEG